MDHTDSAAFPRGRTALMDRAAHRDARDLATVLEDGPEWTLESVGRLVTRALTAYQEECGEPPVREVRAHDSVPALAWLVRRIRSRGRAVCLTASWHSWADRGRIDPEFIEVVRVGLAHGGTLKIVIDERSAGDDAVAAAAESLAESGAHVRVHKSVLPDLLVLDGEAAVLNSASCHHGLAQPSLVVQSGMVAGLAALAEAAWADAVGLEVYQRLQAEEGSLPHSVLSLLSAGCKDEVAARKLNMSVRTYRRHVATIMQQLNATSRFQAGLMAARLVGRPAGAEGCPEG